MMEISSVKPHLNNTAGGMISSDINALKDMIWDDEEDNNLMQNKQLSYKINFSNQLNPNSKKIKKSIGGLSLGQLPGSMGLMTDDDGFDK